MDLMNERNSAILMIIIGIIALAFPTTPVATLGIILAIIVFLIAIALIIRGAIEFSNTRLLGGASIILGILCLILGYELAFNPPFVANLISVIIYILGLLIIIAGVASLVMGRFTAFSAVGLSTILFGIITILVGFFVNDPRILGGVIGVWLIISGVLSLFTDPNKNYIDV